MKNVLVITASERNNSNSSILADYFAEGAKKAGHNVEIISLKDRQIAFCRGCGACGTTLECVIKDYAIDIAQKMLKADVIVFASPVYYYSISGKLKTMLDRVNSLYNADYAFRDIYFLCTATEDFAHTPLGAITAIKGWTDCFSKATLKGTLFLGGVSLEGEAKKHPKMLQKVYDMGGSV